jgi:hypothetical protein
MIGPSDHARLPRRTEIGAAASTLGDLAWLICGVAGEFKLDLRDGFDWLIEIDSGDLRSGSTPTLGFDTSRVCRRGLLNEGFLETISSLSGEVARFC